MLFGGDYKGIFEAVASLARSYCRKRATKPHKASLGGAGVPQATQEEEKLWMAKDKLCSQPRVAYRSSLRNCLVNSVENSHGLRTRRPYP